MSVDEREGSYPPDHLQALKRVFVVAVVERTRRSALCLMQPPALAAAWPQQGASAPVDGLGRFMSSGPPCRPAAFEVLRCQVGTTPG
jgi:hypothetical protein